MRKKQYLDYNDSIKNNENLVGLWIYIGIIPSESKKTVYTLGLETLLRLELVIENSRLALEFIFSFIMSISEYAFKNNIGFNADHKVKITFLQSEFVDGLTCNLLFIIEKKTFSTFK